MEEEKEPKNLWSTLLKESSKRFKAPEATCIFLGDIDVGKNTLLNKIVGSSAYEVDGTGRYTKEIISYSFIDVDEGLLDSDSLSRINMWSISNRTFESSIDLIAKSDKAHRVRISYEFEKCSTVRLI
jgi:Dynein light intermediate chain (DLIC)